MRPKQPFSHEVRERVEGELESGECIQWIDVPAPTALTLNSACAVLFAIPWTGFALFWMSNQYSSGGSNLTYLLGIPFVLIGVGMLFLPVFQYRRFTRTVYAITDRRAIILVRGLWDKVSSFQPDQLRRVYRRERNDGIGDVLILDQFRNDEQLDEVGFLRVTNAVEVERLLDELAEQAEEAKP